MNTITAISKYIEDVAGWKRNETAAAYRSKLARLKDHYEYEIDSITTTHLNEIKTNMLTNLSPWTVKTTFITIKAFFSWCTSKGIISQSPAADVRIPPPPPPDPKAISQDTVEALIQAAGANGPAWMQTRNVAMIYWLRDTGGRISGLLDARLGNIDLTRGLATVTEKAKPRTLFLNPPTVARIRDWLQHRPELDPVDDALFISATTHRALTRSGAAKILDIIARDAGITARHNPHSFRHAFARDCLMTGHADLSQVSQMLGHSSIAITAQYYARWDFKELKKVHRRASPGAKLP